MRCSLRLLFIFLFFKIQNICTDIIAYFCKKVNIFQLKSFRNYKNRTHSSINIFCPHLFLLWINKIHLYHFNASFVCFRFAVYAFSTQTGNSGCLNRASAAKNELFAIKDLFVKHLFGWRCIDCMKCKTKQKKYNKLNSPSVNNSINFNLQHQLQN